MVALFAIRGFLRGLVAQVFVAIGVFGGVWAAARVYHWLGGHWGGAEPRVVFAVMRWLVTGLAGLAIASVFQWWGESLGKAVKSGPVGPVDRVLGVGVGVGLGAVIVTLALLVALSALWPRDFRRSVAAAPTTRLCLIGGETACRWAGDAFPGSRWLAERFREARGKRPPGRVVKHVATGAGGESGLGRAFPPSS